MEGERACLPLRLLLVEFERKRLAADGDGHEKEYEQAVRDPLGTQGRVDPVLGQRLAGCYRLRALMGRERRRDQAARSGLGLLARRSVQGSARSGGIPVDAMRTARLWVSHDARAARPPPQADRRSHARAPGAWPECTGTGTDAFRSTHRDNTPASWPARPRGSRSLGHVRDRHLGTLPRARHQPA